MSNQPGTPKRLLAVAGGMKSWGAVIALVGIIVAGLTAYDIWKVVNPTSWEHCTPFLLPLAILLAAFLIKACFDWAAEVLLSLGRTEAYLQDKAAPSAE